MEKYAIIKIVDENSNCPAAHLVSCERTFGRHGILFYFDTLEEANERLYYIANFTQSKDDGSPHAIWGAKTWSLFCANVARLGNINTRARTEPDGCRYYHDSDVEAWRVVPVVLGEDGEIDARETAYQN